MEIKLGTVIELLFLKNIKILAKSFYYSIIKDDCQFTHFTSLKFLCSFLSIICRSKLLMQFSKMLFPVSFKRKNNVLVNQMCPLLYKKNIKIT
jgi:hypothetical protein